MRRVFGVLVVLISASIATASSAYADAIAQSHPVTDPDLRIGAVFLGDTPLHTCTGSVLDSRTEDLVITAAHCLIGPGSFVGFSPGYDKGRNPRGMWQVSEVYLDPRWVGDHDVDHDYAILRVTPGTGAPKTSIEKAVGGGLRVADNPRTGDVVSVTGYGVGLFDSATTCAQSAGGENGYAAFTCEGFVYGTSGGPWVAVNGTDLVGIIAGPHLGGCTTGVSYSPPFDDALRALVRRAEDHGGADTAPVTDLVDDC